MLRPNWPLPENVAIAFTDRHGGSSCAPYDSLNLGLHVGDNPQTVLANRRLLLSSLALPCEPLWLEQVHGVEVVCISQVANSTSVPLADGSYSDQYGQVCAVMTADCLPVLLCDKQGRQVAAVHAGWRGLCAGVIEQAVKHFSVPACELIACLGPCIGPSQFEVGAEVRSAFMAIAAIDTTDVELENAIADCFIPRVNTTDKYLADMVGLAKVRLLQLGIETVYSADECTVLNNDYFSYRRDKDTGRMASLIWLKS
ncbi:peptidoglycan editing factor PgeF [Shewanella sp. HL-SH5]|uniref:peptidoglycan editing factor PgeF n=1 Tax=Shewanella sp. HL-SH5 TaxID=3436241 RepID=UPI003EB83343